MVPAPLCFIGRRPKPTPHLCHKQAALRASKSRRLLLFEKPTHDRGCDHASAHSIGAQRGSDTSSMGAMGDPSHSLIVVPSEAYTTVPS